MHNRLKAVVEEIEVLTESVDSDDARYALGIAKDMTTAAIRYWIHS